MKTKAEAIETLKSVLHHFRHAVNQAKEMVGDTGTVGLAIVALQPDGSGEVVARLEAPEFFEDVALAIDAGPSTEEDMQEARVRQFLDKLGL